MKKIIGLAVAILVFSLACYYNLQGLGKSGGFKGRLTSDQASTYTLPSGVRWHHIEEGDTLLSFKIASQSDFGALKIIVADKQTGEILYQEQAENLASGFQKLIPNGDYKIYVEKTDKGRAKFNYEFTTESLKFREKRLSEISNWERLF